MQTVSNPYQKSSFTNALTYGKTELNGRRKYVFGFNGQEKSPEIQSDHFTAQFWEYDSRIARRWNLDPKPHPGYSSYGVFSNNPIFYGDPLGDSVRVHPSFQGLLKTLFNAYANSDKGRSFLAKYAAKGQTIAGHTFTQDGEFHKKGIDLNYEAVSLGQRSGETGRYIDSKTKRAQITVFIDESIGGYDKIFNSNSLIDPSADKYNYQPNEFWNSMDGTHEQSKLITLFHESFIHADLFTKDYLDDTQFNNSNIPKAVKDYAIKEYTQAKAPNHYHHVFIRMQYEANRSNNNLWPNAAFSGMKEVGQKSFRWKFTGSDGALMNRLWNFTGGESIKR